MMPCAISQHFTKPFKNHVFVVWGMVAVAVFASTGRPSVADERPNVLLIIIDDLNDWTTLHDKSNPIRTPQMQRLASRGVFFSHAYCVSPACNPSRVSLWTGIRPHRSGIYGNAADWQKAVPDAVTFFRHYKNQGYHVAGAGKLFHHHADWAFHENGAFDEYLMLSINEPYPEKKLNALDWLGSRNTDWGPWPERVDQTGDDRVVEFGKTFLARGHDDPFVLALGIYKPHSPFFAPPQFFERYPLVSLTMPQLNDDDLSDLPTGALNLIGPPDVIRGAGRGFWNGLVKAMEQRPETHQEFVQAYQACASFADHSVGRILDALENSEYDDNTIVVLMSDHGFHVGEKNHVEKFMLWEKTTRIPLILCGPGIQPRSDACEIPVDLTAIYPTLTQLCGIATPSQCDGLSLSPLLAGQAQQRPPALMTYLKGNHAVRTERWRYIRYEDGTEELYDHQSDPHEWSNLAGSDVATEVIPNLRQWIPETDASAVPNLKAR